MNKSWFLCRTSTRRFLECVDDNFLFQVIEKPVRRAALLSLILNYKEDLMGNVNLKGSVGCSDHKVVEFKVLRAMRKMHSKLATLNFRRAEMALFRDVTGRVPWDKALEGRGAQESWLIFKDHILQAQDASQQTKIWAKSLRGLHG